MKNPENIITRFGSADDANVIHEMLLRLSESMSSTLKISSTAQDIGAALSGSTPDIHAIIAEETGKPVGLAVFFLSYSTWRGTRGTYLQDIYVANDVRGRGLGTRLLREVAAWSDEQGADHLRLSVDRDNTAAQTFYEKHGLSFRGDEMIYTIVGDAMVDMSSDS